MDKNIDIENTVINAIAHAAGTLPDGINSHTTLKDDLALDSLDIIEIAMNIEEQLRIFISDDTVDNWRTVENIINSVNELF